MWTGYVNQIREDKGTINTEGEPTTGDNYRYSNDGNPQQRHKEQKQEGLDKKDILVVLCIN